MSSGPTDTGPYASVSVTDAMRTTPARFIHTAAELGYAGIVFLLDTSDGIAAASLLDSMSIDSTWGHTIDVSDRSAASRQITALREKTPIIRATGRSVSDYRFIATQSKIDIFGDPLLTGEQIPHTTLKTATEHGVYIEMDFGPLLHRTGSRRSATIQRLRERFRIIDHYSIPYVITTNAQSHFQLRSPRMLGAIGEQIGLTPDAVHQGLYAWSEILERSQRARGDTYIQPGVKRETNEQND